MTWMTDWHQPTDDCLVLFCTVQTDRDADHMVFILGGYVLCGVNLEGEVDFCLLYWNWVGTRFLLWKWCLQESLPWRSQRNLVSIFSCSSDMIPITLVHVGTGLKVLYLFKFGASDGCTCFLPEFLCLYDYFWLRQVVFISQWIRLPNNGGDWADVSEDWCLLESDAHTPSHDCSLSLYLYLTNFTSMKKRNMTKHCFIVKLTSWMNGEDVAGFDVQRWIRVHMSHVWEPKTWIRCLPAAGRDFLTSMRSAVVSTLIHIIKIQQNRTEYMQLFLVKYQPCHRPASFSCKNH